MAKRGTSGINCLVAVDKPLGCTSHDVVARVRKALGERRVGHAGTLDPAATGVMVVGVGQATRLLGQLALDVKSYIARISFGSETNTDDAEGEVVRRADVPAELSEPDCARALLAELLGESMQVPPAFSAISVNGVRAYKAARAGEEVELEARPITVSAADLISAEAPAPGSGAEGPVWTVAFTVSKGTYIRALARDLGRKAGSAAHLAGLVRTASGAVSIGQCRKVEELDPTTVLEHALDPVACLGCRRMDLPAELLEDIRCGRTVPRRRAEAAFFRAFGPSAPARPERVALVVEGKLAAIAETDGFRLSMKDVFPAGIAGVR